MYLKTSETELHFAIDNCFLGLFLIAQSNRGLCALFLGTGTETLVQTLQKKFPTKNLICKTVEYAQILASIKTFIEVPGTVLNIPLDIGGTPFQQQVWKILQDLPLGKTSSYTDIAIHIGKPKAVRAVANACGANVLAIIIPCHRVIKNDGSLSGYRWGVEFKRILLQQEQKIY